MTAAVAVTAIEFYQRFLSPLKGFRCAHRVRHGRMSCSQFAKRLVQKVGMLRFAPLFRRRLEKCGLAARGLRARGGGRTPAAAAAAAGPGEHRREREKDDRRKSDACDCDPFSGCDVPNLSGCDAPLPDVGDCGAADCGGGCDLSI